MKDRFTTALIAASSLTALFGLLASVLAFYGPANPSPSQIRLVDAFTTLFTAGALTIFALLNIGRSSNRRR
jgi:hypothetical protein